MGNTQNHAAEFSITEKEVKHLVDGAFTFRDRVLVKTLYYTGIRREELCSLDVEDVDLERQRLLDSSDGRQDAFGCRSGRPFSRGREECPVARAVGTAVVVRSLKSEPLRRKDTSWGGRASKRQTEEAWSPRTWG